MGKANIAQQEHPQVRIAVVESHAIWCAGLVQVLRATGRYAVEAVPDGVALMAACGAGAAPHLALVQLDMPVMDGHVILAWLREHHPSVRTVALAYHPPEAAVRKALRLGAATVLCSTVQPQELLLALHDVEATGHHHNALVRQLILAPADRFLASTPDAFAALSRQELRFVQALCAADSPTLPKVAERMVVSLNTVNTYKRRAFEKLGVHSLPALVRLGMVHGVGKR